VVKTLAVIVQWLIRVSLVSGSLLAVARAAGETAPLLFTILTVTTINKNIFHGPNTALSTQIFTNATSPFPGAQARAWGAALTLVIIAFALTMIARLITARFAKRHGWKEPHDH